MRITNDFNHFAAYMEACRANDVTPSREEFDGWCNKKAAQGVTSTRSGEENCDNISMESVEQKDKDVKPLNMAEVLVWLKDVTEDCFGAGCIVSCRAVTYDDDGGAQASVGMMYRDELYTLSAVHEV